MLGAVYLSRILFILLAILVWELYRTGSRLVKKPLEEEDDPGNAGISSSFSRTFIITHTDFDGFASGALLLRLLGVDSGLIFSSPKTLHLTLHQATSGMAQGDSVYIADLALEPKQEGTIMPILKNLLKRQVSVQWFDHHQWPAGLQERVSESVKHLLVDTSMRTAAEMIRGLLPQEDEIASKIIRFLQRASFPQDKAWDQAWRLLLSEIVNRRDHDMSEKVLRIWATGGKLDPAMDTLIRQGLKREATTDEIAAYGHRKEQTAANRQFLVIDVRSKRLEMTPDGKLLYVLTNQSPTIMVGAKACRQHHTDFCMIVWEDFRYSIYRGEDSSVTFEHLFTGVQAGKFSYRVAGHTYAAAVMAEVPFFSKAAAALQFRLPNSAEAFIQILKETL